jgi:mannosyltransferase OCH1-like enzyme
MLSYRKAILTAGLVLLLFFIFLSGSKNISPKDILRADPNAIKEQLFQAKIASDNALKEFHKSAKEAADKQDKKLEALQQERKALDRHLQQLRRLPADSSVRTQLSFQFPYDSVSKFPAYIWQTWKQDKDDPNFDSRFRDSVRSWSHKNPGFVHEVMSDDITHALVQHLYMNVPRVIEAYEAMPENILRADFFRYLILLARGGTYSDVDTKALKPVPNWIPGRIDPSSVGLIVGIEADPDRADWAEWYARRIQFCQWTIQSKPGHPVLRDIVAKITEETLHRKATNTLSLPTSKERGSMIMDWTGPGIWTDSVFEYFNDNLKSGLNYPVNWRNFTGLQDSYKVSDVMVLPITSFSPGVGTMGSQSDSHPLAFVKHQFEGTWKPENERMQ